MSLPDPVEYFKTRSMLTEGDDNAKFAKSENRWFYQVGLTLAPSMESGYNTCAFASKGCAASCLRTTPRQTWESASRARILRTLLVLKHRAEAISYLMRDLDRCRKRAAKHGQRLAIRLNTMSDLPWEVIARVLFHVFDQDAGHRFLDYTKNPNRYHLWLASQPFGVLPHSTVRFPKNYHLTFSRSETNEAKCLEFLKRGGTATIVVRTEQDRAALLELGYKGFPCVNGDLHDRRWEDPKGHWIVLIAKGKAKTDRTGFVVDAAVRQAVAA